MEEDLRESNLFKIEEQKGMLKFSVRYSYILLGFILIVIELKFRFGSVLILLLFFVILRWGGVVVTSIDFGISIQGFRSLFIINWG